MRTRSRSNFPYRGHAHFWERAMARRQFVRAAAGGTAALLGAGLWTPALAEHEERAGVPPKPIPGGQTFTQFGVPSTEFFHVLGPGFPDKGVENSTITDFTGAIASAHILGTATQIQGGTRTPGLLVDHDLRFMKGRYVGVDGKVHHGTFGFF